MLRLSDIVKNYPTATTTVQALRGVSLSFRKHEFVAILGPSGCGKTTMLNIIGGLDRYTSGDLVIGGVSTAAFDDLHWDAYRNATIGFVFQSYNLIPHLTVLENVELSLCLVGQKKKIRRAKAAQALRRVGMGDEMNKRPNQLSGGQQQRVAIARAIVNDPKIILADEPTGALDSELSVQVMDILKEISKTRLVIMVTHNAELANAYCSRICRFKDGQLLSDSNPFTAEEEEEEVKNSTSIFVNSSENANNLEMSTVNGKNEVDISSETLTTDTATFSDNGENSRSDVGYDAPKGNETNAKSGKNWNKNKSLQNRKFGKKPDVSSAMDLSDVEADGLHAKSGTDGEDREIDKKHAGEENSLGSMYASDAIANGMDDDIDYGKLFQNDEEIKEEKIKKVPNRKRKKTMKRIGGVNKKLFDDLGINSKTKKKKTPENRKDKTFKPTSMSPGMAFGLSLRNLISKRGRTIFTAIAGSIGIIGLGLVLSISNGFKLFVNKMQTEMMAGVPLGLYQYNVEVSAVFDMMKNMTKLNDVEEGAYPEGNSLTVSSEGTSSSDIFSKMVSSFIGKVTQNDLSKEFVDYLGELKPGEDYGAMTVFSGVRYNMIAETGDGRYKDISKQPVLSNVMSIATSIFGENGVQNEHWQTLVGDEKFMMEQYEFVGEGHYPRSKNELLLSVDSFNRVSESLLESFGIDPDSLPENVTVNDLIGKKLYLFDNDTYYAPSREAFDHYSFDVATDEDSGFIMGSSLSWGYDDADQDKLQQVYDSFGQNDGDLELEIVGVIRQKKGAGAKYVSSSICYTPELADFVTQDARNSQIVKDQKAMLANESNYVDVGSGLHPAVFVGSTGVNAELKDTYLSPNSNVLSLIGASLAWETYSKAIGLSESPTFINIYPLTYDQKLNAADYIRAWSANHNNSVGYLDVSEMMIHSLNLIIDLVSTLLVAVASISLVVSTAMIGVITSNSVIERTREIGILRSLGARKTDIRNVFVAETSLIGLSSGLLGIIVTYVLCPIISLVIGALTGVGSLLHFNPLHALLLVALSLALTVISGVVPAIGASRKNVVDALRTN